MTWRDEARIFISPPFRPLFESKVRWPEHKTRLPLHPHPLHAGCAPISWPLRCPSSPVASGVSCGRARAKGDVASAHWGRGAAREPRLGRTWLAGFRDAATAWGVWPLPSRVVETRDSRQGLSPGVVSPREERGRGDVGGLGRGETLSAGEISFLFFLFYPNLT